MAAERLLNDIHLIRELRYSRGDYVASDMIMDLDNAILDAELTDRQLEAVRLYYIEGLEQKEIVHKLGISQQAISLRLSKAIEKIASILHIGDD